MPLIKIGEGKTKFGAELIEGQLRNTRLTQHVIRRVPDRREIIHQGAGPINDNVPYHKLGL
jgi:hypothetical protein